MKERILYFFIWNEQTWQIYNLTQDK